MPARRELTMRHSRQMLRLRHEGVSEREIGRTLGIARSTVRDALERARTAGIAWPVPAEWTDDILEPRLFARGGIKPGRRRHAEPDWAALSRELKRPGVNLMVLWEEYRDTHPEGYGYSRYVAARFMLRLSDEPRISLVSLARSATYECDLVVYRAFRNSINDGRERCRGVRFRPLISTLANALAFISRSTSA